jgi:transposase InsO family protein
LGVSRSAYYQNQIEGPKRGLADGAATLQIKVCFQAGQQAYGSRRICQALKDKQIENMGRFKVRRLMREAGLRPVWKRKFVHTTNSNHGLPVAPNRLNREFKQLSANAAWVADITYIRTRQGWLYLAAVMDLYSRKIVGWAMAPNMEKTLVISALRFAVQQRRPAPGLLMHSDQGSQYASHDYQQELERNGMICSMSRRGNCWDNAVMERFFLNLKMERVWRQEYANHAEAERDIRDYIIAFYNTTRLNSVLGNLPPTVFERKMAADLLIGVSEIT